jgi:mRNA interferase RelE/StbE
MYKIVLKKSAQKELSKLPTSIVRKIAPVIDDLAINPRPVGAKKLEAQKDELWRVRVGNYRIVYSIEDVVKVIEIQKVGHRKDIYK